MAVLSNDTLTVEIDEVSLALAVSDKRSGARWKTPGGGFEVQVYNIPLQDYRWYAMASSDLSAKNGDNPQAGGRGRIVGQTATEIEARVEFRALELSFAVRYTLEGDRLVVEIPEGSWDRSGEKADEVISLDCLPLFGAQPRGAEGYLVLPHFGGAVRYFADREGRRAAMAAALAADPASTYAHERAGHPAGPDEPQEYAALVYGYQPHWRDFVGYPLWGEVIGESGWAAYVPFHCGDADTAVVARANWGEQALGGVHGRFHYREHAHDHLVREDRRLVLTFLHEQGLSWAAHGRLYRRYLLEQGGIPSLRAKATVSPETAYLEGAHFIRPMLALKRYSYVNNPNPDGKGILDVYMTCDELGEELRRWKAAGVERALVQIVGANSEGHDGNYPTYFPLEPAVGGEEGFRRLVETVKELGYRSSVHVNIRSYNRPAPDFRIETVMRDRDGGALFENSGPGGDDYGACPAVARHEFAERNFSRLRALGLDGGLYTDFMLAVLFRCYHPLHPLTRRGYLEEAKAYYAEARDWFGAARAEAVVAPLLEVVDFDARIYALYVAENLRRGAEITARGLVDETAPMQAVIFHGIITYGVDNSCLGAKDYWAHFLTLVALDAKPIEELRGPQPQWDDYHRLEYRTLCEHMGWLKEEFIEDVRRTGEVTETVYSDGTRTWVNHGAEPVTVEGRLLPGRAAWVVPGTAEREELWLEEDRAILDREPAPCPDGHLWPDGRPREGVVLGTAASQEERGMMFGKDFA